MTTEQLLDIVLITFNRAPQFEKTLEMLFAPDSPVRNCDLTILDNKSTDDSLSQLKEYFEGEISRGIIKVIENDENRGFANANNLAIEKASGDFILLLNSDTLVEQNTIDKCMDYMTSAVNADVGALGCKVSLADGSLDKACKRSFPNPANSFYTLFNIHTGSSKADYNITGLDDNGVYEIDCLTGAFMLVRKTTVDDIGLLDDTFFMYGEDIDWCYRIKKAGWKIIYFGEAGIVHYKGASSEVVHYKGASSEDKKTKRRNPKLVYEFYRAMYVFYRKHYTKKYNFLLNIAVYIGIFVLLVKNLLANELKRF